MRKIGYIVIVATMVAYALAAVFLDFYDDLRMPAGMPGISYFDLLTSPGDGSRVTLTLGAIVTLFGGAFLIAVMCVLVLTRLRDERATRTTVTVAVGVWSTFVIEARPSPSALVTSRSGWASGCRQRALSSRSSGR